MQFRFFLTAFTAFFLLLGACNQDSGNELKKEDPGFFIRGKSFMLKDSAAHPFSDEIDVVKARAMREYYKKMSSHFKSVFFDSRGAIVMDTLEGFRFNVSDLEKLISNTNGKKAKDIVFYFGRDANDVTFGGRSYPSVAIIAMGIDSSNKIGKTAIDKADPCPPFCPEEN